MILLHKHNNLEFEEVSTSQTKLGHTGCHFYNDKSTLKATGKPM